MIDKCWLTSISFFDVKAFQSKKPIRFAYGFFVDWSLAMTYFHMANATLSSARSGFTSEFGKGSGGSHSLWSPDKLVGCCFGQLTEFVSLLTVQKLSLSNLTLLACVLLLNCVMRIVLVSHTKLFGCYIVKPHEQLVFVSFMRHRTSTPNLSTSWSLTALQGG